MTMLLFAQETLSPVICFGAFLIILVCDKAESMTFNARI